ncbi:alpha/beta-hydrolase [Dendrothele bispora CBS 962.96]|uniref:Alpha/beta-hydrolase n=1 Tax=Dendrothele bispora (strain CBS 962.96) TaxID=1314807 RepID=A0A4S8MEX6_DENBC|nr:alpha/beta-hydrolase [Dendrothele bispora CBS 962.96]
MSSPKPIETVFKQADGIDIYMDIYIPETATKEKPAPIILWWHGGGLLQGTRKGISPHHLNAPSKHNICVVSADYRLAPQFRFPIILSDCASAMTFLHSEKFTSIVEGKADPSRVVLSGSSAGGWLSLLCGTGIGFDESSLPRPPPVQGIAAIYPITDLQDPFWSTKKHPVSYMGRIISKEEVQPFLNADDVGSRTANSALDSPRSMFYHYMVQEGIETELLLGDTGIEPTAYSIAPALKSLTKSPGKYNLPPTFVVHGTADTKVPVAQAQDVAAALEELKKAQGVNVDYEYEEVEGVDHLYDREPGCEMERMYKFINKIFKI